MGGIGSGRWNRENKKLTGRNFYSIDIFEINRLNLLNNSNKCSGKLLWINHNEQTVNTLNYSLSLEGNNPYFNVSYMIPATLEVFEYKIHLLTTNPYFGNIRWWFQCPECNARVAKLYRYNLYVCRKCADISHESKNLQKRFRLLKKAQDLHIKLGGNGNIGEDLFMPNLPKGMHTKTYNKYSNQIISLRDGANMLFDDWHNRMEHNIMK